MVGKWSCLGSFRDSAIWLWIHFNKEAFLNTGKDHGYWLGPHWRHAQTMELNSIIHGIIKAKLTRLCTSYHHTIKGKHISWHVFCLYMIKHKSSVIGDKEACLQKWKHAAYISSMNNRSQHSRKLHFFEQLGLTG